MSRDKFAKLGLAKDSKETLTEEVQQTDNMQHPLILMLLGLSFLYSELNAAEFTDDLSKANNAFAIDLYKRIGEINSGKNLFFSPISISTAFGIVNLGARGQTQQQMKKVLHLHNIYKIYGLISSDESLSEAFKQLLASFKNPANNYTLQLVNRLFGSKVFNFHDRFLQDMQKYFEASSESLNFLGRPAESRRRINNWVEEKTNQKITDLLPVRSIDPHTILIIVNAIYFKAFWVFPFDSRRTAPGPFKISKSNRVQMDMMHLRAKFLHYHSSSELNCEVLELPYKGDKASMFVFLPREVEGLPHLEKQLTEAKLTETLNKVQFRNTVVQLPKFFIDQNISLKKLLQMMGVVDLFDRKISDLSGVGSGSGRIFVTDAMHKAFVNVTEFGTEAAASTGLGISVTSLPIQFIVDRPFLFLIYEKNTKSILFMGRLVRPPTANESIGKFGEPAALLDSATTTTSTLSALCTALFLLFDRWLLQL